MARKECLDPGQGFDKGGGQFGQRSFSDDDQQGHAVSNYGVQFVGHVADAEIVSNGDPAIFTNRFKPFLVRCVVSKMVLMSLDFEPCGRKNRGEFFAKIAIGEECIIQAARS